MKLKTRIFLSLYKKKKEKSIIRNPQNRKVKIISIRSLKYKETFRSLHWHHVASKSCERGIGWPTRLLWHGCGDPSPKGPDNVVKELSTGHRGSQAKPGRGHSWTPEASPGRNPMVVNCHRGQEVPTLLYAMPMAEQPSGTRSASYYILL